MNFPALTFPDRSRLFFSGLLFALLTISGCSLKEVSKQTQLVENMGSIEGEIRVASKQKGPVLALFYRDENVVPVLFRQLIVSHTGHFSFSGIPGAYYVAAFVDVNNDSAYQPEEHGNFFGLPTKITIAAKEKTNIGTLTISGTVPKPETSVKSLTQISAIWKNIGAIVTLEDPRFSRENYNLGLWQPVDFLERAEGGLFFLEQYRQNKIPLLFVHGVNGGPTDWKYVIKELDREHFQPWVVYYPSGLRLDMISNYLVEAVNRLQNKYGFTEFGIISHSMGGLVTRSFVKKYVDYSADNSKRLQLVMTVNSPMAGMVSAATGVKHSPIVVPSWRDVEPGSMFLKNIHS